MGRCAEHDSEFIHQQLFYVAKFDQPDRIEQHAVNS